jgi:hypothetical protein
MRLDVCHSARVELKRLVCVVELDEFGLRQRDLISVSVRLDAEFVDGRRVVLLDDRGWSAGSLYDDDGSLFWDAEEIAEMARVVVGRDEPSGGETAEEMAAGYWAYLSQALRRCGAAVSGEELARAVHDVVLGEQLRSRLATDVRSSDGDRP